jgi:hypothetical protein
MTKRYLVTFIALAIGGCELGGGIKAGWPHFEGTRDTNYDHWIFPGERVGPVALGTPVSEVLRHLGNPDVARELPYPSEGWVEYIYRDECISFIWKDTQFEPKVGGTISITCGKWKTRSGISVGMPVIDAANMMGDYCAHRWQNGSYLVEMKPGMSYHAANREAPVNKIDVYASEDTYIFCKNPPG